MGKKRKLEKAMAKRELAEGAQTLVICGGKKCAPRDETRATADEARAYAANSVVGVEIVKCLHVCEKGPIAATYPKIRFHKRVGPAEADVLVDKLAKRAAKASDPVAAAGAPDDAEPDAPSIP